MSSYRKRTFFLMAMDPVHIGTGGFRLGRVDNTIVREPGTKVPKIPGTSLSGASRSYAAMRYEKLQCAGQGDKASPHCGETTCPICYTFGSLKEDKAYSGTINVFDAQILFFPVHSMIGPVWVTTARRLEEAGFSIGAGSRPQKQEALLSNPDGRKSLNFGWLLLNVKTAPEITAPSWGSCPDWDVISDRLALLHEGLFGHVVNSNLEVRTSVSIDPMTGAAKDGALFTYEAIPRSTWLSMDVVQNQFREGDNPWPVDKTKKNKPLNDTWSAPVDVFKGGMALAEWLGIGGMGTRGFGRLKITGELDQPVPWEGENASE